MRLLILGGTGLIGPPQIRYAVQRGHKVTVFNRGKSHKGVLSGLNVEELVGDRNNDLSALKNRDWDAVIDNPAMLPKWVRDSASLLSGHAKKYLFVSSISVYADETRVGQDENGPLQPAGDPNATAVTGPTYGPLKVATENEARKAFGQNAIIVRPGLIIGPGDETGRFLYWPLRLRKGGDVLAPGDGSDPLQYIDVRDLAEWTVRLVEGENTGGTYNAFGPKKPQITKQVLEAIKKAAKTPSRLVWIPTADWEKEEVAAWGDLPLWVPGQGATAGFHTRDNRRAVARGLTFRSMEDITAASLAWYDSLPAEQKQKVVGGLSAEREAELLAKYGKTAKSG